MCSSDLNNNTHACPHTRDDDVGRRDATAHALTAGGPGVLGTRAEASESDDSMPSTGQLMITPLSR